MEVEIKPGNILLRAIACRALEGPQVMCADQRDPANIEDDAMRAPGFPQIIPGNFNLASDCSGQY
jgi:hypothetical protein